MKNLNLLYFVVLLSLAMSSCQSDDTEMEQVQLGVSGNAKFQGETAYPGEMGENRTLHIDGEPHHYARIRGENIFEGDIILTDEQIEQLQQPAPTSAETESVYTSRSVRRWPNAVVPYVITHSSLSTRALDAMAHIEANSKVNFVARTGQKNYIRFVVSSGCSSKVGMAGGAQDINLGSGCTTGNTIHELMHALGFYHEQTRSDRDGYITVNRANIKSGHKHNFNKKNTFANIFGRFDFGSIMMYGSYYFSKNNRPTIVKKDGSVFSVQRKELSLRDEYALNHIYPSLWSKQPGGATDIGIGANGHTYITGASWKGSGGYDVYRKSGNTWLKLGGHGVKLAVSPGGIPWLINAKGEIFRRSGSSWQKLPGKATDIGIGANGHVYITGHSLKSDSGYDIYKWNGSGWSVIGGHALRVAVQSNGKPMVVNKKGEIFRRGTNNWIKMDGRANDIGIGPNGRIFITGYTTENGQRGIFQRVAGKWERISGSGTRISVDRNGLPWVVNQDKNIFRLTTLNP